MADLQETTINGNAVVTGNHTVQGAASVGGIIGASSVRLQCADGKFRTLSIVNDGGSWIPQVDPTAYTTPTGNS
jgi:hypothetical protein